MKAYKGFDENMRCRGFQFEEGKTYHEEKAKLCGSGFHACESPLDVFNYYRPGEKSIYREVELEDLTDEHDSDSKRCGKTIKIGAAIGIKGLVKAHLDIVFKKTEKADQYTSGEESSAATSGDWSSAATSGYRSSAATSGEESSAATSGEESSAATSGYRSSAATSGYRSSAATSGDWSSAATSGYRSSAATSGNGSSAATSGEESSAATKNKNGIALACGKNAKAKGVIGSHIVVTEWDEAQENILAVLCGKIDGQALKPDAWYTVKDGKFVEAEE